MTEPRAPEDFWNLYEGLPASARRAGDKQFSRFRHDHGHPSLHFKQDGEFWSVRVTGTAVRLPYARNHDEYERLIG